MNAYGFLEYTTFSTPRVIGLDIALLTVLDVNLSPTSVCSTHVCRRCLARHLSRWLWHDQFRLFVDLTDLFDEVPKARALVVSNSVLEYFV